MIETRKFNKEQARDILYEGGIMNEDDSNELYVVVDDEVTDTDQEKGRVTRTLVIKEVETDKYFSASLDESPWCEQASYNAKAVWEQVIPYSVTVTKYRKPTKADLRDMKIDEVTK